MTLETCTQCKQKAEIPVDQWVCDFCVSKSKEIAALLDSYHGMEK